MYYNSLHTLTEKWFDDLVSWKVKPGSLKKRKINSSVTSLSKNKQY